MAKQDKADVSTVENRDFYPEDAQERNLKAARELSVINHEHDTDPDYDGARIEDAEARTEIPAQPGLTATKNPEQVKTNEDGDSSVKGEELTDEEVREHNEDEARETAEEADEAERAKEADEKKANKEAKK